MLSETFPSVRWRGVFVEPVPILFERLEKTYAFLGDAAVFVNAAVNATCARPKMPFFVPPLHGWMSGLGSLSVPKVHQPSLFVKTEVNWCVAVN